jgi:hypothetical protein
MAFMKNKLEEAFTIMPRNGAASGVVWVPRTEEEKRIRAIFSKQGKSICLDGPTGTGKSSIALTAASAHECFYIRLQIVRSLDWLGFSTLILDLLAKKILPTTDQMKFGLVRFLPEFSFQREKHRDQEFIYTILDLQIRVNEFDLHKLAYILSSLDVVLILDDFEKASTDLLQRFADLTKLLTDTFRASKARILFVGTHDIYRRLRKSDDALAGRLEQVSVGTLEHSGNSWNYLSRGFEALGFYYPGRTKFSKRPLEDIIATVYESANGLLKSLSDLGKAIAIRVAAKTVSESTIIEECKSLLFSSIREYETELPGFVNGIVNSPGKKLLMKWLFQSGVGRIHNLDALILKAGKINVPLEQVENAYEDLRAQNFLVEIGYRDHERTFYVTDPRFTHIFGVICTHHAKYGVNEEICRITGQLELSFYLPRDEELLLDVGI